MTKTTVDIENLKEIKKKAIDLNMTFKELVNKALSEYLRKIERK